MNSSMKAAKRKKGKNQQQKKTDRMQSPIKANGMHESTVEQNALHQ